MSQACDGAAVLSYGATLEVQAPEISMDWVFVGGITDFNGPSATRAQIDATTLCSTAKEYVMDLKDNGTFTSNMHTRLGNAGQQLLWKGLDSYQAKDMYNFRLTIVDDGYGNGPVKILFKGWVQNFPIVGAMGQLVTSALSLRITGDVAIEYPVTQGPRLVYRPTVLAESAENDGTVAGVVSVVLEGGAFAATLAGVSFSGVPAGLTAQATRISGNTAVISFSGAAASHNPGTKADVGITFADAAFAGLNAADVAGSSGRQITINFV